jgi:ankyrin repeat protein
MAEPNDPHWRTGSIDAEAFDRLYAVIDKGPDAPVLDYLRGGGDPNLRNREFGWTLLHAAAFKGRRSLLEALIAAGADIEALEGQSFTPLASAAHKGHIGCVKALLAAGASPDCRPLGQSLVESLQYAQVKSPELREVLLAVTSAPRASQ